MTEKMTTPSSKVAAKAEVKKNAFNFHYTSDKQQESSSNNYTESGPTDEDNVKAATPSSEVKQRATGEAEKLHICSTPSYGFTEFS